MILKRNFCIGFMLLSAFTNAPNAVANQLTYQWEFGDGNISTEENPNHQYTTPDFYTVTLKAFADQDLSYSKQYEVDAVTPAIKSLTLNIPKRIEQGKSALLSVKLESDYNLNLDYKWTLPNDKVANGSNSEVVFENSGENKIALTAYFKERPVSEQNITVNVLGASEPDPTPPSQGEDSSSGSLFWICFMLMGVIWARQKVE
ncbi:PKD domain-containing protein [Pseudoalteromonas luteoviolacea]|uniref:PKD domain-containing protein n=1 Tax=Pseudoalteromonas luteoviolacea NCIMB 1942 TaxID=1365253 RepID=A0A166ZSX3_9GAMM|nr:PKD domain-containing protein [Pseudoalteromonas luteoviolacea]KZN44630.1 hypothetical protein N482_16255 [Pseudoalteromonas luteoviolacea NCIMB 1942]KZW99842.1 hypothetical protein JL49_14505 [Pseudoalteromonas luteoviolacea]